MGDPRDMMQDVASDESLGVRELLLLTPGEDTVVVSGAGAGGQVVGPPVGAGPDAGMDRHVRVEDIMRALTRVTRDSEFGWFRCADGVVVVVPVGDGRLLAADFLGSAASGSLLARLTRVAEHLRRGSEAGPYPFRRHRLS